MDKKLYIYILLALLPFGSMAQTLTRGEYFFDSDPGTGNGMALTPFTPGATVNQNFSININALSTGFHTLNTRLRDNTGKWSHFQTRIFYLAPASSVTPPGVTVTKVEYFFDADPGQGNGTNVPVTATASLNQNIVVPITSLSNGFHNLNFRVRDDKGKWSHFATRTFYIVPPLTNDAGTAITKAEYFIDNDPGVGLGTSVAVSNAAQINQTIVVPITSLSPGFHNLNFRVRDDNGLWSHFATRTFYIVPPAATLTATSLKRAEYFFDTDPGVGLATSLPVNAGNPLDNSFSLDISSLSGGFHRLVIRYQDNQNKWSHFAIRTFYIIPANTLGAQNLVAAEYFIDTDPDLNPSTVGTSLNITPSPAIDASYPIDLSGVPSGNHTLYVRAKDDKGQWSVRMSAGFSVLACTPPSAPASANVNRCGPGTVSLTATGASATQVYRWYDDGTTSTVLFTGSSFTTPVLTTTRNYYVSVFDPVTLCESSRTLVTATIEFADKPAVNPSGSLSFCAGNSVLLSAPVGSSQYAWSNGETTRQILVSASGKYTVQIGNGSCLSPASDTVFVSVVEGPTKPVITVTGNTTVCGTGTAELTAPSGFQYIWSTGATTQSITVSQTGIYYVSVRDGSDCPSIPSDPVAFTVLTPPCDGGGNPTNQPPAINATPFASQIEGKVEVDVTQLVSDPDNNLDFNTLRVVNNETSRGVPAFIDESYILRVDYSGNPFTGTDRVTIEVCDLAGACTQQVVDIEVVGDVVVYNGVTPDGDGFNDFLLIKYIDSIEGAQQNKVSIYSRWGDVVFETTGYDNKNNVFKGLNQNGSELPSGTYFYKIEIANRAEPLTGFLTLLR